jgi:hypothetical protein
MALHKRSLQELVLLVTAAFAIVWAVIRAQIQSITIDEAFTYLFYASRPFPTVFEQGSNNHVLNTLLMWIATRAFGTSNISVRLPALLGAVLYVSVCYFLCKNITSRFSLRLALFVCLTYNPFIFDFMVAARGYSLADAFLLTAIAVPVWNLVHGRPSLTISCAIASLALGLSFTSNFSFAFVDGLAFLALAAWAIRQRKGESIPRIVGSCALPGLVIALLLCGYPLAHWQHGELWWGAHSLREMRQSLTEASLYRLDPRFQYTPWYKAMDFLRPRLLRYLAILCCCQGVAALLDGSWLQAARTRWMGKFAAALAAIAVLSVTVSWLAFRFFALPLPLGRTGIFLVPLCTLVAGIIAAAPARSRISQWLRRGTTGVMICLACYFLLCLRLSYFKEYHMNADMKDVYSVLARLNHTYGVNDVGITRLYITSLNYYRTLSHRETFPEFAWETPEVSPGRSIYVMSEREGREFIDEQKLVIVYRGAFADVVVAVKPGGPIPPTMIKP